MIDWYLVSVLVFTAILAGIFYKDRKNVKRESILLLRKTQKGKRFLIGLGTRFPRFWKILGVVGVIICFLVSGYTFLWLLGNSVSIFVTREAEASFMFVLPSASSEAATGPGYLAVPFWYWIISIALLVVVHEGMHGVMAAMERVKIKSLGWGVLAIIPLAFVEPDEKELTQRKPWTQLRVFAAGSFANFLLAGLCILIGTTAFSGVFVPAGVAYRGVIAGYPAAMANLTGTIIGIDDYEIRDVYDLRSALEDIGPNRTITVYTLVDGEKRAFAIVTVPEPEPEYVPDAWVPVIAGLEYVFPGTLEFSKWVSGFEAADRSTILYEISFWEYIEENYHALEENARGKIQELRERLVDYPVPGFIGISGVTTMNEVRPELQAYSGLINFSSGLLFFIILINFGVGVANLLPIKPLDGGRMWEIVFQKAFPKKDARSLTKALSSFTLLLLIVNFLFPILF